MAKIKRLFNDPYDIVEEMVEGYVGAHKQYVKMCDLDEAQGRVVLANDAGTKDKVGVIIGGGSGHEPLFIGYVGEDFADAVVIGNINTSPSPDPCYAAAKACDNGKGCIYLYGNYAGDVMNFDMGAEKADEEDDIRKRMIILVLWVLQCLLQLFLQRAEQSSIWKMVTWKSVWVSTVSLVSEEVRSTQQIM